MEIVFHEESFILAEKTLFAGIANSLTGDTLCAIFEELSQLNKIFKRPQMEKLRLLIAFILLSNLAFCQSKPTKQPSKTPISVNANHKGWRDLNWESTEADVTQKYGSQLIILEVVKKYGAKGEWYCPFEIHNYELGNEIFTVSFLFDENTKKLVQVNVAKENPLDVIQTLKYLETSLNEKYGKPKVKEETPKYISKWSFTELNIELTYLDIKLENVQIINTIVLSYRKPKKSQLEKF